MESQLARKRKETVLICYALCLSEASDAELVLGDFLDFIDIMSCIWLTQEYRYLITSRLYHRTKTNGESFIKVWSFSCGVLAHWV